MSLLDILLCLIYLVWFLGGVYTVLFVTRIEKDWFEEHGFFISAACALFTLTFWPFILGLFIYTGRKIRL